jgi:hypothetical protein
MDAWCINSSPTFTCFSPCFIFLNSPPFHAVKEKTHLSWASSLSISSSIIYHEIETLERKKNAWLHAICGDDYQASVSKTFNKVVFLNDFKIMIFWNQYKI